MFFRKKTVDKTSGQAAITAAYLPQPPSWDRHTHIYAILDAAQDEKIYKLLMSCSEEFTCLYNGDIPSELARVAPYLVKLPTKSSFFEEIFQQGFYNNWGIFFTSSSEGKELKRHFQSLLRVKTEDGKRLYFRYYDPRVLRVYLPTCTKRELNTFFGDVNKIWVAGDKAETVMEYGRDNERFYTAPIDMSDETIIMIKEYMEEESIES